MTTYPHLLVTVEGKVFFVKEAQQPAGRPLEWTTPLFVSLLEQPNNIREAYDWARHGAKNNPALTHVRLSNDARHVLHAKKGEEVMDVPGFSMSEDFTNAAGKAADAIDEMSEVPCFTIDVIDQLSHDIKIVSDAGEILKKWARGEV
jgi:hypothetical protein